MSQEKQQTTPPQPTSQPASSEQSRVIPKPESTPEYEGSKNQEPTGDQGEVKTETSSSSGE